MVRTEGMITCAAREWQPHLVVGWGPGRAPMLVFSPKAKVMLAFCTALGCLSALPTPCHCH